MNNNYSATSMLALVDARIKKILNTMNVVTQYTGVVTAVQQNDNIYQVRLAGSSESIGFPNKTNQKLEVGDSVYIQTIANDLNTGIITAKFNSYNLDNIYLIGDVHLSTSSTSPAIAFGGVWELVGEGDISLEGGITFTCFVWKRTA